MSTAFPHSHSPAASGLLTLSATLLPTPAVPLPCPSLPSVHSLLLADRLAELYEIVFPDKLAWLQAETAHWPEASTAARAVERFLSRVNDLFPVHTEVWEEDDWESIEWRLYDIPVMPMGIDTWHEDWDEWKEPIPYLLHQVNSRGDEYLLDDFACRYPAHLLPRHLEPRRLLPALRELSLPQPLAGLPDLITMVTHSSGNFWIDCGELMLMEGGNFPSWHPENVAWLAAEWQAAAPVTARIDDLLGWQNDTPDTVDSKLTAVCETLLAAWQQVQEKEQNHE